MTRRANRKNAEPPAVVITCEHGGCQIPRLYRHLFRDAADVVKSHRGWDPGTLKLAKLFAADLEAPLFSAIITRLLVELNRSFGHPRLFSEFTESLDAESKLRLLADHWHPYRREVEQAIARKIDSSGRVVHLSVHSFTPVWNEMRRKTDIGLLYDPRRLHERDFCRRWRTALLSSGAEFTVHRNAPYRGTSDGFVTALRRQFADDAYIGIELEVNQRFFLTSSQSHSKLPSLLTSSFRHALMQPGD